MLSVLPRRQSVRVQVGPVAMGGIEPIRVQAMTNTDTADIDASASQVVELADAGAELVRLTVADEAAAKAIPRIRERLLAKGVDIALVGDFHFNGHRLLKEHPACAEALDKFRINPGNVGRGERRDRQFAEMIDVACQYGKAVRIGVNWGSLDSDLLSAAVEANNRREKPLSSDELVCETVVRSALESAAMAESLGLGRDRIVISCKHSHVQALIAIYRSLAAQGDYCLHVGLTEAGMGTRGIVASVAAVSVLLAEGIGDTIRLSLTPSPGGSRAQEVVVACELLQSMGYRSFRPTVISCPGCGRTRGDFFVRLAADVESHIERRLPVWRKRCPGVEDLTVAVMGCVVNGPGESRQADIGVSLPGANEALAAPVYVDGQKVAALKGENIADEMKAMLDDYVERRFLPKHD